MRNTPFSSALLFLFVCLATCPLAIPGDAAPTPDGLKPLTGVHSHNDYEHRRPLLDALDQGFCSIEADIYLVDGKLLVAHDRAKAQPDRTLEALYLDPLQQRVRANGGRVYKDGPPVYLLIDFKTDAAATYAVLRTVLERYSDMLSKFSDQGVVTNAILVVASGNSPREQVAAEPSRLISIDGRLPDLDRTPCPAPSLVPWISENWGTHFKWRGWQEIPAEEWTKLTNIVSRAHAQGRQVRFWGTVDGPALWETQRKAGVDFINTDKLAELRSYMLEHSPAPK